MWGLGLWACRGTLKINGARIAFSLTQSFRSFCIYAILTINVNARLN